MKRYRHLLVTSAIFLLLVACLAALASTDVGAAGSLHPAIAWINAVQRSLYEILANAVRHAHERSSPWPLLVLFAVSFAYGVLHAVGPGHGKIVISSYLVASGSQARKGLLISFASALVQAASAIILVGVLALALNLTRMEVDQKGQLLEEASYALIILLGVWMLVSTFRAGAHCAHLHAHHGADARHDQHIHEDSEGTPSSAIEFGPLRHDWRHYLAVIFATGIRPCSGAILVLLFCLAQKIFVAGIVATFVMALGTSITISALALLAVASRRTALSVAAGDSEWQSRIHIGLSALSAVIVVAAGCVLLFASLSQPLSL
ncbi:MAG TPA: nickel/cobalt transporter [Alphaproteobacteria bacterium]|nr:nickel/cobalt transporter [Alphaproteobacteria bacterium]